MSLLGGVLKRLCVIVCLYVSGVKLSVQAMSLGEIYSAIGKIKGGTGEGGRLKVAWPCLGSAV